MNQPSFTISMGPLVYLPSVFAHLHQHRRANDNKRIAVPKPDDTADALAIAICHAQYGGTTLKQTLLKREV